MYMENRFFGFFLRYDYLPGQTRVFLMRTDSCTYKSIEANFFGLQLTASIPDRWPSARAMKEMEEERRAATWAASAEMEARWEAQDKARAEAEAKAA